MRQHFLTGRISLIAFLISPVAFGQTPTPTDTPAPTPILVSTATPTPSVSPSEAIAASPTLTVPPLASPSPTAPISVQAAALGESDLGWSEKGAVRFTIDQAVLTALQQNPDVLRTLQEIERTKGVIIEIRAQALPHIGPSATWGWTDP